MLTKNPKRYHQWLDWITQNVILRVMIETDEHYREQIPRAPLAYYRYAHMRDLHGFRKMVAIEPMLDFHSENLRSMISDIEPEFVCVGYDNHGYKLSEPALEKTLQLIEALREFTEVRTKTLRKAWWE